MGDVQGFEQGKYKIKMAIVTEEDIQIRDMALEAARQSIHKDMTDFLQKNYFLRCHCYPHNILRNNRVFSGGSKGERVQTGMSKSFGSPEGRAATLRKGLPVFSVYFNGEENIHKVKTFFSKASPKLPCKSKFTVERLK
jgi:ribosomal protein L16/L10AE